MLLRTILNRIEKYKGFVYTTVKFENLITLCILITIAPRKNSKAKCSKCMKSSPGYDKLSQRRFKFIPIWNIPVYFVYTPRRVSCKEHGVVVEHMPWAQGKCIISNTFKIYIAQWARILNYKQVSERFGVGWRAVWDSIVYVVDYGLEHRDLKNIKSIGVDEIAIGKNHKYATMVYQIDGHCRRLLWIGKDRKTKTLLRFFLDFGKENTKHIKVVCSDMWKPYLKVIAKKLPQALNILDRFHIMKKFNDALDDVRIDEVKKLEREGYEPVLKKSRWLIAKRPENLTEKQKPHLKELLKYNLQSVRAYLLREDFQHFWEYKSPAWAKKFLDEWLRKTILSQIEPMKKVAKMLRRHEPLILNWFKTKKKYSSGIVEAINNTAKVTMRNAYGFKRYKTLKYALYHRLGELPLPEITHKYF